MAPLPVRDTTPSTCLTEGSSTSTTTPTTLMGTAAFPTAVVGVGHGIAHGGVVGHGIAQGGVVGHRVGIAHEGVAHIG